MAKHQNLSSPYAIHPFAYSSNANPASDAAIDMAPYKGWIDTSASNTLKVRNAANNAWEDVSVAGAATTTAFGSNSNSVAVANAPGASTLASRADHVHLGVRSISHASNTFSGPVILTTPGDTVGITVPTSGTLAFTAAGAGGGGGSTIGQELSYVEFTSPVSPTATTEGTANTVVTSASVAYNGSTIILIEFYAPWARPAATSSADLNYWLYEDGSSIGLIGTHRTVAALNDWKPTSLRRRMTPSNASHTYSIRASVSTGTASIQAGVGGVTNTMPGYIRITRCN